MPEPASLKVPISDMDSSSTTRNEQGVLQRDRVREGVRKIQLSWNLLTQADVQTILTAVKPASFQFAYPDPEKGTQTITAYAGDRSPEMVKTLQGYYWKLSFDVIEY